MYISNVSDGFYMVHPIAYTHDLQNEYMYFFKKINWYKKMMQRLVSTANLCR